MPDITQDGRLLKVSTPLAYDVLLIDSISGYEAISQPFRFDIELLADVRAGNDQRVLPDKLVGKAISIGVEVDPSQTRFLNGIVRSFTRESRNDDFARYRVEMVPWVELLALRTNSRIFQGKTVPDIIAAIVSDSGFSSYFRDDLSKTYTEWDYCVQHRETDLAFISRLMEAEGISYFFEHKDDRTHMMVLVDAPDGFKDCPFQSKVRFDPEAGTGELESTVDVWKTRQQVLSGKWAMRDHHLELPGNSLEVPENSVFANDVNRALEHFDYPGEYAKKFNQPEKRLGDVRTEGEQMVRTRMEQEEATHIIIEGRGYCRVFTSGHKVTVDAHGAAGIEGSWLLTSVQHNAVQYPDYVTEGRTGQPYTNSFNAIDSATKYHPPRVTPKPLICGPQTAFVIDEHPEPQEEIWPDKFGRVRVRFHWDREAKYACWIRVAQAWAGRAWGHQWIPRVGDEVVVTFLDGDPDCPLIVGSVYNPNNMPPFTLPDNKTQSGVMTRSSPNGGSEDYNMFRMEDKAGKEEILLHAQKQLTVEVEKDEERSVGGKRTTIVKADDKRTVQQGNDELTVDMGDRKATISKGNESLTVSLGNITIQASVGTHKTEAMQIEMDGTATIKLSCGASSIEMTPATISITSPLVKIN